MRLTSDAGLRIKHSQKEFKSVYSDIKNTSLTYSENPRITTATILLSFRDRFPIDKFTDMGVKKKSVRFSNQTTVKVGNSSLKIFENGKIHVTGVKSISDACIRAQSLLTSVGILDAVLVDVQFQMINIKFRLDKTIILTDFIQQARRHTPTVFYDPSRYPGVRVKMIGCGNGTALVFATGSVLLTGANSPTAIRDMMVLLSKCIEGTGNLHVFEHWLDNVNGVVIDCC